MRCPRVVGPPPSSAAPAPGALEGLTVLLLVRLQPTAMPWGHREPRPLISPERSAAEPVPQLRGRTSPRSSRSTASAATPVEGQGRSGPRRDRDDAAVRKNKPSGSRWRSNLRSGDMPPAGAKRPTADEMELLNRWLDARRAQGRLHRAAQTPAASPSAGSTGPSTTTRSATCVGVDFQPAKDFPADDVGYGFDNIGDVLSLPPLLMEKYLAAAEKIVEKAFRHARRRGSDCSPASRRGPRRRAAEASWSSSPAAPTAGRRPPTRSTRLLQLRRAWPASRATASRRASSWRCRPCWSRRTSSSASSPTRRRATTVRHAQRLRAGHAGCRTSSGAACPTTSCSSLPRRTKLRKPGVLEAQVRADAEGPEVAGPRRELRRPVAAAPQPRRRSAPTRSSSPSFDDAAAARRCCAETELFFEHVVARGPERPRLPRRRLTPS